MVLLGSGPYMYKHAEISTALIYLIHFDQILCIFALFGVYFVTNFLFLSEISGLY